MNKKIERYPFSLSSMFWDLWCMASIIGIWPRFIEPKMISTTHLTLPLPRLPKGLDGLKILQFSDLHLHRRVSESFLNKLVKKVRKLSPDIICFTGDFLCYGLLDDSQRLQRLLRAFAAPYGCYAILGNHDYQNYVSINDNGDYDLMDLNVSTRRKGWKRLFNSISLTGKINPRVHDIPLNQQLVDLLKERPFELLHNETRCIAIKDCHLNICGLGEYMLGRCNPKEAFREYNTSYPGIILAHNPDSLPSLKEYPGDVVLCGHTHGGQVNLPGLYKKFMLSENQELHRGLHKIHDKWVYVNRGMGGVMQFRWFSMPELLLLTLKRQS